MSLNSLVINTLKPTNTLVRFQSLWDTDGSPKTYILFFDANTRGSHHGDDRELSTEHLIQVDIYNKGDYTNLVKQVKDLMIDAGFRRQMETESYENDTKYYHKTIRFLYEEEIKWQQLG